MDYSKQLEDDLSWREAEIGSLKVLISTSTKGSVREITLLRALWAILYAHYEGFCKFAWDLYLNAVEEDAAKRSACKEEIASLSLEKDFKNLKRDLTPDSLWNFCTVVFPKLLNEPTKFHFKLETQSNLWPHVFVSNTEKISLSTNMVNEHSNKLRSLVSRRNDIAHGQKMVIRDIDEYQKYENAALLVMHELAVGVIESIENKSFLKLKAPPNKQSV
jgi:hypothetical protein